MTDTELQTAIDTARSTIPSGDYLNGLWDLIFDGERLLKHQQTFCPKLTVEERLQVWLERHNERC